MIKYYMPTKVYWGSKVIASSDEDFTKLGKAALIVTGKRSAELSGALAEVTNIFRNQKIEYHVFDEVSENPELETVHRGAELFREKRCGFLTGIGGGSPIDAAKAISVIAANNLTGREIYEPAKITKAFPIVAVPTTSGTGTEVTPYSVISDKNVSKKGGFGNPLIFPVISFCDPRFTYSLPEQITIDTALDALSHLLEGIYSRNRCEFLYPFIFQGITTIIRSLEPVLSDPENYELRENLMRASLYGGIVIAQGSTTLQHSIGYPLTTHYGLSHGMANAVVMEKIMELFSSSVGDDLKALFTYTGYSREEFFNWLRKWIPLKRLSLPEAFVDSSAEEIMGSRNMAQNPQEVSVREIKAILNSL